MVFLLQQPERTNTGGQLSVAGSLFSSLCFCFTFSFPALSLPSSLSFSLGIYFFPLSLLLLLFIHYICKENINLKLCPCWSSEKWIKERNVLKPNCPRSLSLCVPSPSSVSLSLFSISLSFSSLPLLLPSFLHFRWIHLIDYAHHGEKKLHEHYQVSPVEASKQKEPCSVSPSLCKWKVPSFEEEKKPFQSHILGGEK